MHYLDLQDCSMKAIKLILSVRFDTIVLENGCFTPEGEKVTVSLAVFFCAKRLINAFGIAAQTIIILPKMQLFLLKWHLTPVWLKKSVSF